MNRSRRGAARARVRVQGKRAAVAALIGVLFASPLLARPPVAPALDYHLSGKQLAELRRLALAGDAQSSRRIADFEVFVEHSEGDYQFWLRLAAEQGHCDSMLRLAQWYRARSEHADHAQRALDWDRRALASDGCPADHDRD